MQVVDFPAKNKIDFIEKLLSILPTKMKDKYKINFGGPTA